MGSPHRILPWLPHVLFAILEPIVLLADVYVGVSNPSKYLRQQVPSTFSTAATSSLPIEAGAAAVVYQLENVYLLLSGLGVLILFFTDLRTAKGYLALMAVQDVLHVYGTYAAAGSQLFWDTGKWSQMVTIMVWVSTASYFIRIATVVGVFGDGPTGRGIKGKVL